MIEFWQIVHFTTSSSTGFAIRISQLLTTTSYEPALLRPRQHLLKAARERILSVMCSITLYLAMARKEGKVIGGMSVIWICWGMLHFCRYLLYFHVHAYHIFRLQPLIECFDDDGTGKLRQYLFEAYILNCYGTGWISVKEANQARILSVFPLDSHLYYFSQLTTSSPKGWRCVTTLGKLYLN